jgi:UDP-glucose 4-epimerase
LKGSSEKMIVFFGGNGFIGRHLTIRAHAASIDSIVISRTPDPDFIETYAPSAANMTSAEFDGSAGDEVLMRRASALIYLASGSVPSSNVLHPTKEIAENVAPAFDLFLRIGRLRPSLPIIFISSGGTVYGRANYARIPETAPLRPISPYGLGKVMAEQCLQYCGDVMRQRYAILRASNAIGRWHRNPKQGLTMAVLRAIESGTPLHIYGNGTAVRDYVDADDLADAIIAVALGKFENDAWNVASGVGHSILDIVDSIERVTGRRPEIVFQPDRGVDVASAVLDPSKMLRDFGWKATTPLLDSLRKMLVPKLG